MYPKGVKNIGSLGCSSRLIRVAATLLTRSTASPCLDRMLQTHIRSASQPLFSKHFMGCIPAHGSLCTLRTRATSQLSSASYDFFRPSLYGLLWMDEILRHLRNTGNHDFQKQNTNKPWVPMVSKWRGRVLSIHSIKAGTRSPY